MIVRRGLVATVTGVALLGIAVLVVRSVAADGEAAEPCRPLSADRAEWQAPDSDDAHGSGLSRRQEIADRLVRCRTLMGLPYTTVTRVFGQPDDGSREQRSVSFMLGEERQMIKLDPEYLNLDLDASDRVVGVDIGG